MKKFFCLLFVLITILIFNQRIQAEFIPFFEGATAETTTTMTHQSTSSSIQISIDFPGVTTKAITEGGNEYTLMSLNKGGILGDVGDPQIPCVTYYFEVPQGVDVQVQTTALSEITLIGNHTVYPNQEIVPNQSTPFDINNDSYTLSTFLPTEHVIISMDSILRGRRVLQVAVPALLFNPTTQQAKGVASIDFALIFSGTPDPDAEVEKQRLYSESFETLCARILTNYEPVIPGEYEGEITGCDYLIITHEDLVPALNEFISWKNKKGFLTQLISLDDTDSMNRPLIKSIIQTAYDAYPAPVYVLIVGDQNRMLPFYEVEQFRTTPHDYDYSLMDGEADTLPDVFMARIPVFTLDECATVIGKQLEYEMTPMLSDYYKSMLFAGKYQDKEDPECEEEFWLYELITRTMQYYIDNTAINRYTAMYNDNYDPDDPQSNCEVYNFEMDSDYPHRLPYPVDGVPPEWVALWQNKADAEVDIVNAYNSGIGCSIYSGHGLPDQWGEPEFNTSDVDSLSANRKYSFTFSMTCLSGRYNDTKTSLTEALLQKNGAGSVGVIANANAMGVTPGALLNQGLMTGFYPDYDPSYSGSIYEQSWRPGEVIAFARYYAGNWVSYNWEHMNRIHQFFGDPEMMIRTDTPQPADLSVPVAIPVGSTILDVASSSEGALVGVSQNGRALGRGYVENGVAHIELNDPVISNYEIDFVVSGQNLTPFIGYSQPNDLYLGSVHFNSDSYDLNDLATIFVIDPDVNENPETIDTVSITLTSSISTDATFELLETDMNTGVFEAKIKMVDHDAGPGEFQIICGEAIRALYHDSSYVPETDVTATADMVCTPRVLFGGYMDTAVINHDEGSCARLNVLCCLQPYEHDLIQVGMTDEPADPWQQPNIGYNFEPISSMPGYYQGYEEWIEGIQVPSSEMLLGIAGVSGDGSYSHHWPYVPIKLPEGSNGQGDPMWYEHLIEVPNAAPNSQMLSTIHNTINQMADQGTVPGEKPIIWAAGYFDSDLIVGQAGKLKLGTVVSKDQMETEIEKISIIDDTGYEKFRIDGPGAEYAGFYWFYKEWEIPEIWSHGMNQTLLRLKVVNDSGEESEIWPYLDVKDPNEFHPEIIGTSVDKHSCTVIWTHNNDVTISNFNVKWKLDEPGSTVYTSANLEHRVTDYTIENLDECQPYKVWVEATDVCQNPPMSSNIIDVTPSAQPIPQNVEIDTDEGHFYITWSPNGMNRFALYEGFSENIEEMTFVEFVNGTSILQPEIQDIAKCFALRTCDPSKPLDLECAGCFSLPVWGKKRPEGSGIVHQMRLIELNNDGIDDLVLLNDDGDLIVYLGQSDGSWIETMQSFPAQVNDYTLFDFNKDSFIDIAVAAPNEVQTHFNDGTGSMTISDSLLPPGSNKVIAADDLDNKGTSDVVVGNTTGTVVKANDESGQTQELQYLDSGDTKTIVAEDLDGDGKKDLITATETGENIVWTKDEDGLYSDTGQSIFTWGTESIEIGDVNNDGCPDLIVTDSCGLSVIFINDCTGNFTAQ